MQVGCGRKGQLPAGYRAADCINRMSFPGVIPRTITHLFVAIEQDREHTYALSISYLEVYTEKVCLPDLAAGLTGLPTSLGSISTSPLCLQVC